MLNVYWITSGLFSTIQNLVLNALYPPVQERAQIALQPEKLLSKLQKLTVEKKIAWI